MIQRLATALVLAAALPRSSIQLAHHKTSFSVFAVDDRLILTLARSLSALSFLEERRQAFECLPTELGGIPKVTSRVMEGR
jgi:hypothetical protein